MARGDAAGPARGRSFEGRTSAVGLYDVGRTHRPHAVLGAYGPAVGRRVERFAGRIRAAVDFVVRRAETPCPVFRPLAGFGGPAGEGAGEVPPPTAQISPRNVAAEIATPATPRAPAAQASAIMPVMMPALASTMATCSSAAAAS